jgi:hypothetical protein
MKHIINAHISDTKGYIRALKSFQGIRLSEILNSRMLTLKHQTFPVHSGPYASEKHPLHVRNGTPWFTRSTSPRTSADLLSRDATNALLGNPRDPFDEAQHGEDHRIPSTTAHFRDLGDTRDDSMERDTDDTPSDSDDSDRISDDLATSWGYSPQQDEDDQARRVRMLRARPALIGPRSQYYNRVEQTEGRDELVTTRPSDERQLVLRPQSSTSRLTAPSPSQSASPAVSHPSTPPRTASRPREPAGPTSAQGPDQYPPATGQILPTAGQTTLPMWL